MLHHVIAALKVAHYLNLFFYYLWFILIIFQINIISIIIIIRNFKKLLYFYFQLRLKLFQNLNINCCIFIIDFQLINFNSFSQFLSKCQKFFEILFFLNKQEVFFENCI